MSRTIAIPSMTDRCRLFLACGCMYAVGGSMWFTAIGFLDEALASSVTTREKQRVIFERTPRARALIELAAQRVEGESHNDPSAVLPLYLRPFEGKIRKR